MFADFTNIRIIYKPFIDIIMFYSLKAAVQSSKHPLKALIILSLSYSSLCTAQPDMDWSTAPPEPTIEQNKSNQKYQAGQKDNSQGRQVRPAALPLFEADTVEADLIPPAHTAPAQKDSPSQPAPDTTSINKQSTPREDTSPPKVSIEPFLDTWNRTGPQNIETDGASISAAQARKLNNVRYEPIWRPFFSHLVLEDFNAIDCCTRVMQSTLWEAEAKCEKIGHKVWQVGIIRFTPETTPVSEMKSCYLLSKTAIGNAWHYRCSAKAQAKCYDPKLPQNYDFIVQLHSEQVVHDSLEEGIKKGSITPLNIKLEHLLEGLPDKPAPPPPKEVTLPHIELDFTTHDNK